MIVPMKKASLIMRLKDASQAVDSLAKLGLLHIRHQKPPRTESINSLNEELVLLNQAISIILSTGCAEAKFSGAAPLLKDYKYTAQHIVDSKKRLERLDEYLRKLLSQISFWQEWGDFDPKDFAGFSGKGVFIKLYSLPAKEIKNFPAGVSVHKISSRKGMINCAAVSEKDFQAPFKEISLPELSVGAMRKRVSEDSRMSALLKEELGKHARYLEGFLKIKKFLQKKLEYQEALGGVGESGELVYFCGFLPFDKVNLLEQEASRQSWGLLLEEPAESDSVPTLIRNPRWVSIIEPVFKMIEVVPGYRELDISLWVLLFLSVFFGMLIGDAGYAAIFLLLTFLAQRKWGRRLKDKSVFPLFYLFSFCALAWGVLSGTFFGQEWLLSSWKPLMPALRDGQNLKAFCFFLGALHLSIAHLWRAIIKLPSLSAFSECGWISILWGAFFLAKTLILGELFPDFAKWLFISGVFLVLFFSKPQKNILKTFASGMGNLLLNLVNNFTDVVSYIRLFAVGLATVAVADTFNKIAMDIGFNSFISGGGAALILLLGHALNIALGPMSVLVHGVRLNVLEFSNHIDVKWSGFSYNPLRQA